MQQDGDKDRADTGFLARSRNVLGYLLYVLHRFLEDQCLQSAAALTYTTLLALVPLLTVTFAAFSAFEAFSELQVQIQNFIFRNFVPNVGSVVQEHLQEFTSKTRNLSIISAVFLFVTSIMLLSTISGTFNHIWRVGHSRGLVARLPIYWVILTLTPLLLGASIVISTYLYGLAQASGVERFTGSLTRLAVVVPVIVQVAGLFVLYRFTPDYPVRWADAMSGAVIAGIVLEILKHGFGVYVRTFPTYQTIYGALAAVPIFLIWMYVVWTVVLWGAEMAAALPEWRAGMEREEKESLSPASVMAAATSLLSLLLAAHRVGGGLRWRHLLRTSGQPVGPLTAAAEALRKRRYIELSERNAWFLSRDLENVTLGELYRDLGLSLADAATQVAHTSWGDELAQALRRAEEAGRDEMDMTLESLLSEKNEDVADLVVGGRGSDDDEEEDTGEPADYKNRLLGLFGLAWLTGRRGE